MARHIRDKSMLKKRAQTTKPKTQKTSWAPPAHMQDPPEPMQLPLDECMQTTSWNRAATSAQLSPVRPVDKIAQHLGITPVRPGPLTGPADATWETARAQKSLETTWKPSKCVQQAISSSNFSPLLTMHESSKKCQTIQPRASQINKIQHRMLHRSKWAS
jgi:hypothetical protein